jgi:hypothetical protein
MPVPVGYVFDVFCDFVCAHSLFLRRALGLRVTAGANRVALASLGKHEIQALERCSNV